MKLALLGLGAMGARVAARLLAAGHTLTVWNRSPARAAPLVQAGAQLAGSPREAAEGAELVFAMLTDDDASRAVWLGPEGAAEGLGEGAVAVELSTLTPGWIHTLAAALPSPLLDAPVVGTLPHAEGGKLQVLVGGTPEALSLAQAALEVLGVVHAVGAQGQGAALKLSVNALFAVQAVAVSEQLAALVAAGIPMDRAASLLNAMPTASPAAQIVAQLNAAGRYSPLFPVDLVEKDLRYAVAQAERLPMTRAAGEVYRQAQAAGLGGENLNAVAKLF